MLQRPVPPTLRRIRLKQWLTMVRKASSLTGNVIKMSVGGEHILNVSMQDREPNKDLEQRSQPLSLSILHCVGSLD